MTARQLDIAEGRAVLRVPFGHEHNALHIYASQCPRCRMHRGGVQRLGCDV